MRMLRYSVLVVWLALIIQKSQAQYFYYRTKPDAGLIVGYDFSRLNLTSYYSVSQKRNGTPVPYIHFGGYLNIPLADNIVLGIELMYARYGMNYRYRPDMYELPNGIDYDLNRERIQYLINNFWFRCKYGRGALQGGVKVSGLLYSSGTERNLIWSGPHNDLYQKINVRFMVGAEYAFFNGAITAYLHSGIPIFFDKNILSAEDGKRAFPNSTEMRLLDLQIGTKVRFGK